MFSTVIGVFIFYSELLKIGDKSQNAPLGNKMQLLNSATTRHNLKEKASRNMDPYGDMGAVV